MKRYKFHRCIKIVKGHFRSIIYDLNRNDYFFLPNIFYYIYENNGAFTVPSIMAASDEYGDLIEIIWNQLIENEYLYKVNPLFEAQFIEPHPIYDEAAKINNAEVVLSEFTINNLKYILSKIDSIQCSNLSLISYDYDVDLILLSKITKLIGKYSFKSVEFIIPYKTDFDAQATHNDLHKRFKFVRSVNCHSSDETKILFRDKDFFSITYEEKIKSDSIPKVDFGYFTINQRYFYEAKMYNPYFYKKMHISSMGEIKNVSYFEKTYGNILSDDVSAVVNSKKFRELWNFKKDDISKCRECEFRYMCFDGRIPNLTESGLEYETDCNYNIITGKWVGENL